MPDTSADERGSIAEASVPCPAELPAPQPGPAKPAVDPSRSAIRWELLLVLLIVVGPATFYNILRLVNNLPTSHTNNVLRLMTIMPSSALGAMAEHIPCLAALLYICHLRRVSWRGLGFRWDGLGRALLSGVLLALVLLASARLMINAERVSNGAAWASLHWLPGPNRYVQDVLLYRGPVGPLGLVAVFAGLAINCVWEEAVRGYVIRRTTDAWGSLGAAVMLSVVVFMSYHTRQSAWAWLTLALHGFMYAAWFLKRRSIAPVVLGHFLYDAVLAGLDLWG
jgi:hypothetical protein